MAKGNRKNDRAWNDVAEKIDLLSNVKSSGYCLVSATQLKEFSNKREPRLMAKMDFDQHRPEFFRHHELNVLPLKRGEYVVFRDRQNICFFSLPLIYKAQTPKAYVPKLDFESLDTLKRKACTSEQDALALASLSSLLSTTCDTSELKLTKTGRFASSEFQLHLPDSHQILTVKGAQIEVDGIYESIDTVALVEAKMGFSLDFNIRQLFYPYRWLSERTKKRIVPILLCYSNNSFRLNQFTIGKRFGEIEHAKQDFYVLDEYVLAPNQLAIFRKNLPSPQELPNVPFPQADDLNKVVDVIRLAQRNVTNSEKLAEIFGFTPRQADYYKQAARYLGFTDELGRVTADGTRLLEEQYRINATEIIVKAMMRRPALREAIDFLERCSFDTEKVTSKSLAVIIEEHRPDEFSQDTLMRRASSLRNWLKWLVANGDFA